MKSIILQAMPVMLAAALVQPCTGGTQSAEKDAADYKIHTGTLKEVNALNRTVDVKGFWLWSKPTFHVGEGCRVLMRDQEGAGIQNLRPGQRVHVRYRILDGVKVANQITEDNPTWTGHISVMHPENRTFQIRDGLRRKDFIASPDCIIVGREDQPKRLADLNVGHRVVVTFLDTGKTNRAVKIEHGSQVFTGTLEAIDADARMLRAQHLLSEERFTLASSCPIVVEGRTDGALGDLRLGDKLLIHYEVLDGVRVANRVERHDAAATPAAPEANQARK
jgi:hypothetical protein